MGKLSAAALLLLALLALAGCGGGGSATQATRPTVTGADGTAASRFILSTDVCALLKPAEARRLLGALSGRPRAQSYPATDERSCYYRGRADEQLIVSLDEARYVQPPLGVRAFEIHGLRTLYDPATHGVDAYAGRVVVSVSLLSTGRGQAESKRLTAAAAALALARLAKAPGQ